MGLAALGHWKTRRLRRQVRKMVPVENRVCPLPKPATLLGLGHAVTAATLLDLLFEAPVPTMPAGQDSIYLEIRARLTTSGESLTQRPDERGERKART